MLTSYNDIRMAWLCLCIFFDLACVCFSRVWSDYVSISGDDKTHLCVDCGQVFSRVWSDYVSISGDDKSHLCVDCGQVFSRKSYLVRHRMTHSGEKRFCCEVCGKGFTWNSSLTIHLTSHTGKILEWEQVTDAQVCFNSFSPGDDLSRRLQVKYV